MCLATEPDPGVDQPERNREGVHDHFPLGSLFILVLQKLQSSIQLDDLFSESKHIINHACDQLRMKTEKENYNYTIVP